MGKSHTNNLPTPTDLTKNPLRKVFCFVFRGDKGEVAGCLDWTSWVFPAPDLRKTSGWGMVGAWFRVVLG